MDEKQEVAQIINIQNKGTVIERKKELERYNLDKKWNDYIAILEEASLYEDNVENIHRNQTAIFAYFRNRVVIDDKEVIVRISVKKKVGSNHFHIHHIDTNEKSPELLGPSRRTEVFEIQDSNKNLTDN